MKKSIGARIVPAVLAAVLLLVAGPAMFGQSAAGGQGGRTIGILYLAEQPQLVTQGISMSGYQEVYGRLWKELGREEGFTIIEASEGSALETGSASLTKLLSEDMEALVIYRVDPSSPLPPMPQLEEIPVPVLLSGYRLTGDYPAPYVGFDGYGDGLEIGRQAALEFEKKNPDGKAYLVTVGIMDFELSNERVKGFLEGFMNVIPDAQLLEEAKVTGDISNSTQMIQAILTKHPDVNVLFGAGENPTLSILGSFTEAESDDAERIIIAGFAVNSDAVSAGGEGSSPVDVVALLPVRGLVEKALEVLKGMLDQTGSGEAASEYLLRSTVVSEPSPETLRAYFEETFGPDTD